MMRELSAGELDQVSGGDGCTCGSGAACITQEPGEPAYNCGGTPLFGGSVAPVQN
jgi:hypothetical protein